MTPKERAEKIIKVAPVAQFNLVGRMFSYGEYQSDTERFVVDVQRRIEAEILAAIQDREQDFRLQSESEILTALLKANQQAYSYGLPLSQEQETEALAELRPMDLQIADQLANQILAYRGLLAAMAHDNGYQEGYEKGRKDGAEEGCDNGYDKGWDDHEDNS